MVAMALIVRLRVRWIAALGLGMIATHNLLDRIDPAWFGKLDWLWVLLHTPGRIAVTDNFAFPALYVLIPWVGVMAAGFAFGPLLLRPDHRKWILRIGICATMLFFVLRVFNFYGNGISGLPFGYPRSAGPWSIQPTFSLTVISFFNTLKYPPSLHYLLMVTMSTRAFTSPSSTNLLKMAHSTTCSFLRPNWQFPTLRYSSISTASIGAPKASLRCAKP